MLSGIRPTIGVLSLTPQRLRRPYQAAHTLARRRIAADAYARTDIQSVAR
jgi:hypothetical protein